MQNPVIYLLFINFYKVELFGKIRNAEGYWKIKFIK